MKSVNIIPMAGNGQRFIDAGYSTPKPLIKVKGQYMFKKAVDSLPTPDHWIFICQDKHIKESGIDIIIKNYFPNSDIVITDGLTSGQATSTMKAIEKVGCKDNILIGTCDNSMFYKNQYLSKLIENNDVLVWTFRNNKSVLQNPDMYGWVKTDSNEKAKFISCKKAISKTPLNDHAIIGTFNFKNASVFINSYQSMINKSLTVNNEYYIDTLVNESINLGYNVSAYEVCSYVCFGTPKDVNIYNSF